MHQSSSDIYYSETPARKTKRLPVLFGTASVAAALAFGAASFSGRRGLYQTAGVILLVAALYFLTRLQVDYTYRVQRAEVDGKLELCVIQRRGRRLSTMCRLLLCDLMDIHVCDGQNGKELLAKYPEAQVRSYCADLSPARWMLLHFSEGGVDIVLKVELSEEMVGVLERYKGCV